MTAREQFTKATILFGFIVLALPPILLAAHWLRFGEFPQFFPL